MTQLNPIRVLLVDDHAMIRRGLALSLQIFDDIQVIGEAENGRKAIQICPEVKPHVILMDLMMPEMDGVTATTAIRQRHPDVKVIALTSFNDAQMIPAILKAGASDYLLKNISIDDLASAIRGAVAKSAGPPAPDDKGSNGGETDLL